MPDEAPRSARNLDRRRHPNRRPQPAVKAAPPTTEGTRGIEIGVTPGDPNILTAPASQIVVSPPVEPVIISPAPTKPDPQSSTAPIVLVVEPVPPPIETPASPEIAPPAAPLVEPLSPVELKHYDTTNIDQCIARLIVQRDRQSAIFQTRIDELIALREKLISENA